MTNNELRAFCASLQINDQQLKQPAQARLLGLGISTLKAQIGSGSGPQSVRAVSVQTEKIVIMLKLLKEHAPQEYDQLLIKALKK